MAEGCDVGAVHLTPEKKSRYTVAQHLVIAREIADPRAHTPPYGEKTKQFEEAATNFNEKIAFACENIVWKPLQDRYQPIQEQYCKLDDVNQQLSGVGGGEMREFADLLMTMQEAKDVNKSQKMHWKRLSAIKKKIWNA